MAGSELDIDKIVHIFRDVIKRKTTFNETNLHYEYFKRAGDTIPYKAHGFASLRELIQKKAGEWFYFEKVGNDFEFIAPKRVENANSYSYSEANSDLKKITVVKPVTKSAYYDGVDSTKTICVSNNIHFGRPQASGSNNSVQNIRNDIKISFDFDAQKREVDRCSTSDVKPIENESSTKSKQLASGDVHSGTYSMVRDDQMEIDEYNDDLPWDDKYWHLKITHAVSTNEIWARFFYDFKDPMRKMTAELNEKVNSDPKHSRIRSGNEIHVVKDMQNYHRAIIVKVEPEINQSKCFLIDVGEVKWFKHTKIFRCPYEFCDILPMAMQFSLYGLIELKDNRDASEIVAHELTNKEFWAKIKMTPKEFYKGSGKHQPIPIVLYDAINKCDRVNISSNIMKEMIATFRPPKLSKDHTNYVTITHISKVSGHIYCHINNVSNDLKYVNSTIQALIKKGIQRHYEEIDSETELHELLAINADKLHLVYLEYDRSWYRALIVQLETDLNGSKEKNILNSCHVYCYLVDYGHTRVVNLSNVYNLPGILAHYPHLAVTMALAGVHMTYAKIDRLKTILLPGENVFVDVVESINSSNNNQTRTMALTKVTKFENKANGETHAIEINRIL